jgi:uncharacterized protein YdcH (DUF465 family)
MAHAAEHRDFQEKEAATQEEEATTLIEQLQEVNRQIAELVGGDEEATDESDVVLLQRITPLRKERARLEDEIAKKQRPIQ